MHTYYNCIIVVLYLLSVNSSNELMFTIVCIRRKIKRIVLYCIVLYCIVLFLLFLPSNQLVFNRTGIYILCKLQLLESTDNNIAYLCTCYYFPLLWSFLHIIFTINVLFQIHHSTTNFPILSSPFQLTFHKLFNINSWLIVSASLVHQSPHCHQPLL